MTQEYPLHYLIRRKLAWRDEAGGHITGSIDSARAALARRDARVINSLGSIIVPSLVVVRAQDTQYLIATDYMQRHIAQSRKFVIEDAGHAANMDQPEFFNTAVRDLLEQL